jgi:hypothetical protein
MGEMLAACGPDVARAALWPYRSSFDIHPRLPGMQVWAPLQVEPVAGWWLGSLAFFAAFVTPGFLVLSESFRRYRVQRVHILRGAAYSLIGPAVAVLAEMAIAGWTGWRLGAPASVLAVVWLCIFWWSFVALYLRLKHAAWVALSMLVIAGLSATIVSIAALVYTTRLSD